VSDHKMTGYDRARITAHWLKTKPTFADGRRVSLEDYIRQVCKKKGWIYKPFFENY